MLLSHHCKEDMQSDPITQGGSRFVKTFGDRLRGLRRKKDLSQRVIAERVGVNFTYLSQCETGTLDYAQYPSEDLIQRLAC